MPNGQFPEIIQLADLNGKNGFKIDGEEVDDNSGAALSNAGDINGDGYADLLIGSDGHAGYTGRSYVVLGSAEVGSQGLLSLAMLNGDNGFKLDGEFAQDYSGSSMAGPGDINGDGYDDLIIGACRYAQGIGRSYVVFGGPGVDHQSLIALSSLNGTNGFKFEGEAVNDWSGVSMSSAGDVNGDGYIDLMIGALYHAGNTGRSYVVFGGPGLGRQGLIALSSINGANGFKIDGEQAGEDSGSTVGAADVNGDGYTDLLIGAYAYDYPNYIGRSYVVFGGPEVGRQGLISLASLNGANGFKLYSEGQGDSSGAWISAVGDINGDGFDDMIIGAPGHAGKTGRSYVVFGGLEVGGSGNILLSDLNGTNGFKLDGEASGDVSGNCVNAADFNNDGYPDLLIGAPGHADRTGRSYVVFGGPGVGESGNILLSDLNGNNGFKLDGEVSNDYSGGTVSTAGDVDGDGIADFLIGAYQHNAIGRSYVIFGDTPPILVNNSLNILSGEIVSLNIFNLAAYDHNHDNSTLVFIPTNITHGRFESIDTSGVTLSNFTQQQIWDGNIQFVHDGSSEAPVYNITVRSEGIAWTGPIAANITFNNFLNLENNQLVINQGQAVVFTSDNLKATHLGEAESDLSFLVSDLVHGQFEFFSAPNQSVFIFQQQNITDGMVRFVHDNSPSAPSYRVAVSNGTFTTSTQSAFIDFDANPILVNNTLSLHLGETVVLTNKILGAIHPGGDDKALLFHIFQVQQGQFSLKLASTAPIVDFYQQNITDGLIQFTHDNSLNAPTYQVSVSDGRITMPPQFAEINFDPTPPAIIQLSSLNGQNGFKLDGENEGDGSGCAISAAGDINGDGYDDLIIGANYYLSSKRGRSYVVFGGLGVGRSGVFNLSSLDGANGFKLDGENDNDQFGFSVSAAGDINGDGYDDLIIGAIGYPGGTTKGRSYVVFGDLGVGSSGYLAVSSLNGANGFRLDGENNKDASGNAVSAAGDINGDGYDDIIIGATYYPVNLQGRSYVVFGGLGIGSSGYLNLSSLNGVNGFKLDGEHYQDQSGYSVSAAGDINGDGYDDVLIGAVGYLQATTFVGRSYLVFGGPNVGSGGVMALSSLNGTNGFKLDGENNVDVSGRSVSAAGDINSDGYDDLIVGADQYPSNGCQGRSYVVFGGPNVGSEGVLSLSSLNGANGFKLDGEENNDRSGWSTDGVGDINGDGHADLIIGAWNYPGGNGKGRSYVVLGGPGVGSAGVIALSNLNGTNGFKFDGEYNGDGCGASTRAAGDINGDGITDLIIGAYGYPGGSGKGRSYVVFGYGSSLAIKANQLIINQGQAIILTVDNLQATYKGNASAGLNFLIANLQHGRFEWVNVPGQAILAFQQQNITDGLVRFVHDNTTMAPAYQVAVRQDNVTTPFQAAKIDFDANPVLVNNTLAINQGETIVLTNKILGATHPSGDDRVLLFNITQVQQGQFNLNIFSQQNIVDGLIQFTHDNSLNAPAYHVSVSDGRITLPPELAVVNFDTMPILLNNTLRIDQGQRVILQPDNLLATQPFKDDSVLTFMLTAVEHGNFSFINAPDQVIFNFQQQNITMGIVQFIHDNTPQAPTYCVAVTDGRASTTPQLAFIDFDAAPVLLKNQLTIGQGQTVNLTSGNLLASHAGTEDSDLNFIIGTVEYGNFLVDQQPVLLFSQRAINNNQVSFSHDNSLNPPNYTVSVSDGRITTLSAAGTIQFDAKPVLQNNQLFLSRGQKLILTTDNLLATHNGAESDDLQFMLFQVQQGQFEQLSQPGVRIDHFIQKDVRQQQIVFIHNNSTQAPSYQVKVSDGWMDSEVMSGMTLLAMMQPWLVNQSELFALSANSLSVVSDDLTSSQIRFTVSNVRQAQFESIDNPGYALPSFTQQQVTSEKIILAPDGTLNSPQCNLIVNGQDHYYGTLTCPVDFDAPPTLDNAYLKTSPSERVQITKLNLKASTSTRSAENLIFQISEINHGYFADSDQWKIPLINFTQQKITDGDIIFITDESGKSPQFKVLVWDGRLHCQPCPQLADVVFQAGGQSDSNLSDVIKNALIGAVISGAVGLLFFALRYKHSLSLQRNARPTIDGEEKETYPDTLLLPIAREVFSRIKITGCLGYIGKRDYNEYIGAVSMIVAALETKEVIQPNHWNSLPRPQKQRIIDAIAMHTKELVGNNRCCSTRTFTSFYKAEATPRMIRNKAQEIADAVQETLSNRTEAKGSRSRSSLRLTHTSASLNESQIRTPLLQ